jgi:tetratricopeptide (TPR) repeat protein
MIVKNAEDTLRPCLESIRGLVSEIVIADTGSTDGTCDIAREFGATLISFPWINHFSKARNAALKAMTTDWVLVLDADEEIDCKSAHTIPDLLNASQGVGGYITPIRNYLSTRFNRAWDRMAVPNDFQHERGKKAPSYILHENCRLFRNHPDIYFTGLVHELVESQVRATGLALVTAPFYIHHFGQMADQERRDKKTLFYRDLLRAKTVEWPNDPIAWTQLGLHEFESFNQPEEALACFDRALHLNPMSLETWLFKGMVLVKLEKYQEALDALEHDTRNGSSTALHEELRGDALYGVGNHKGARAAYRRSMKWTPENWLLASKLGYTEVKLGQRATGLTKLRRAAKEVRDVHAVHDRLMRACIMADRLEEAADVADNFSLVMGHPKLFMRAASIRARLKQWDRAEQTLSRGLQLFPDSADMAAARAEVIEKKLLDQQCASSAPGQVSVAIT